MATNPRVAAAELDSQDCDEPDHHAQQDAIGIRTLGQECGSRRLCIRATTGIISITRPIAGGSAQDYSAAAMSCFTGLGSNCITRQPIRMKRRAAAAMPKSVVRRFMGNSRINGSQAPVIVRGTTDIVNTRMHGAEDSVLTERGAHLAFCATLKAGRY